MMLLGTMFLLLVIVFFVLSIISLVKRNGSFKRNAIITFISFVLFIVVAVNNAVSSEVTKEVDVETEEKEIEGNEDDKEEAKDKKDETVKKEQEQKEEETKKEDKQEFSFDDFSTAEYSVENIEAEIKDDTLHFGFRWINQSGEDIHFTALGYIDVSQGDEILEETSGSFDPDNKSGILFKNAYGGAHRVDLEYELENDEDIRILFGTTLEGSDTKEELIIEIN